jgi:hypothetical protein
MSKFRTVADGQKFLPSYIMIIIIFIRRNHKSQQNY